MKKKPKMKMTTFTLIVSKLRLMKKRLACSKKPRKTKTKKKPARNQTLTPCLKNSVEIPEKDSVVEPVTPVVEEEGVTPLVKKYWFQRYNLFSLYDQGIKMDEEGWFSVTPEEIAIKHAQRIGGRTVIDCFTGVGGNAIQFAKMCYHVIAIDIDPQKIELAYNNARVYGVEDYIDFVVGDFFHLASSLKGDVVFLSPPWGGPTYKSVESYTLDRLKPKDGYSIFQAAQRITPNIIMFLPRNVDLNQLEELSWLSSPPLHLEVEENYVQSYFKGITAYFGNTAALPPVI